MSEYNARNLKDVPPTVGGRYCKKNGLSATCEHCTKGMCCEKVTSEEECALGFYDSTVKNLYDYSKGCEDGAIGCRKRSLLFGSTPEGGIARGGVGDEKGPKLHLCKWDAAKQKCGKGVFVGIRHLKTFGPDNGACDEILSYKGAAQIRKWAPAGPSWSEGYNYS